MYKRESLQLIIKAIEGESGFNIGGFKKIEIEYNSNNLATVLRYLDANLQIIATLNVSYDSNGNAISIEIER